MLPSGILTAQLLINCGRCACLTEQHHEQEGVVCLPCLNVHSMRQHQKAIRCTGAVMGCLLRLAAGHGPGQERAAPDGRDCPRATAALAAAGPRAPLASAPAHAPPVACRPIHQLGHNLNDLVFPLNEGQVRNGAPQCPGNDFAVAPDSLHLYAVRLFSACTWARGIGAGAAESPRRQQRWTSGRGPARRAPAPPPGTPPRPSAAARRSCRV